MKCVDSKFTFLIVSRVLTILEHVFKMQLPKCINRNLLQVSSQYLFLYTVHVNVDVEGLQRHPLDFNFM